MPEKRLNALYGLDFFVESILIYKKKIAISINDRQCSYLSVLIGSLPDQLSGVPVSLRVFRWAVIAIPFILHVGLFLYW